MAVARDQAARMLRSEPETADREAARDDSAALAESLRSHVAEETKRRPSETPVVPAGQNAALLQPEVEDSPTSVPQAPLETGIKVRWLVRRDDWRARHAVSSVLATG